MFTLNVFNKYKKTNISCTFTQFEIRRYTEFIYGYWLSILGYKLQNASISANNTIFRNNVSYLCKLKLNIFKHSNVLHYSIYRSSRVSPRWYDFYCLYELYQPDCYLTVILYHNKFRAICRFVTRLHNRLCLTTPFLCYSIHFTFNITFFIPAFLFL